MSVVFLLSPAQTSMYPPYIFPNKRILFLFSTYYMPNKLCTLQTLSISKRLVLRTYNGNKFVVLLEYITMQMITDFFSALSRIFRMVDKTAATAEKLINQTAYNLDESESAAKYKAIAARRTAKDEHKVTEKEEKAFDADFWN